jgi:hypothetical protein
VIDSLLILRISTSKDCIQGSVTIADLIAVAVFGVPEVREKKKESGVIRMLVHPRWSNHQT